MSSNIDTAIGRTKKIILGVLAITITKLQLQNSYYTQKNDVLFCTH